MLKSQPIVNRQCIRPIAQPYFVHHSTLYYCIKGYNMLFAFNGYGLNYNILLNNFLIAILMKCVMLTHFGLCEKNRGALSGIYLFIF